MAKSRVVQIKMVSSAKTGYYYVTTKNAMTIKNKLRKRKYDPVIRQHVEFVEDKIK